MKIKHCLLFFLAAAVFFAAPLSAEAMNTGFTTESFESEEEVESIRQNIGVVMISEPAKTRTITCFDVSKSGHIAIGCNNSNRSEIYVYSPGSDFLRGYSFGDNGLFGVEWDGEDIIVYSVRGSIAWSVDSVGNIKEILKIPDDAPENNRYWNKRVYSTVREVNGTKYRLRNQQGIFYVCASDYSLLTAEDSDGTQRILYDATDMQRSAMLGSAMIVIPFVTIVLYFVIKRFRELLNS